MTDATTTLTRAPTSKEVELKSSWRYSAFKTILSLLTSPYRRTFKLYTWKPLKDFRKVDDDRKVLIAMIRDWKMDKYAELQSVQVAASFCAGATLATISWSKVPNAIWVADALWFSSLICSIWAIITSIQMKSILDDLPNKDELNSNLPEAELQRTRRVILRYKKNPGLNHWVMLYIWQFPSQTMSYAWCTFLSGLSVYVCTPFIRREAWSNQHKIAIVYLIVGGIGLFTYFFSSAFVYVGEKAYERSAASTRINTNDMEAEIDAQTAEQPGVRRQYYGSCSTDPVQVVRAKGLREGERQESSRRGSGRSKRSLLY